MRALTIVTAIAALSLAAFGCGRNSVPDSAEAALLGDWRSTALEGTNSGDFIRSFEFSFRATSEFSATATMTDGSKDTKSGTWSLEKDQLTMEVDGEAMTSKIEWRDGRLIIHDPEIDSRIILKKR